MTLTDYIVLAVIALVVGGALAYIIRAKKRGVKCIGCPDGSKCSGHCSSCGCGCGGDKSDSEDKNSK